MKDVEFTSDMINIMLQQLGASKIKTTMSQTNSVLFVIKNDVRIRYEYGVSENGIYLQRVEPYPMLLGEWKDEHAVINMISADVNRFRHACSSSNYETFLENIQNANDLRKFIENLFLLRNVDAADMRKIADAIEQIKKVVFNTFKDSRDLKIFNDGAKNVKGEKEE